MLTDCTVSGNSGPNGGGVWNSAGGTATLTDCTVSGNSASQNGGGLYNASGTVTIGNTIVAGNTATKGGPDASGTFASQGNNLIGETDGSSGWVGSDLTGTVAQPLDPLLAPLAYYGGPTETMALLPGSPAIDAGSDSISGLTVPTTDQRGALRGPAGLNAGTAVDIGAYEASSSYLVTTAADSTDVGTLRAAVAWANISTNANPANIANPAPNTIVFDTAGLFSTSQTITLSPNLGTLELSNTSTAESIDGPGAGVVTVSGGNAVRVFQVDRGVTATLSGLNISRGSTTGNGGGLYNDGGTTTLTDVAISGNAAGDNGGALYNSDSGMTTLAECTISGNSAGNDGGVYTGSGSMTTVTNCTISGNAAAQNGGGLFTGSGGTTTLTNTTVSGSSATSGGGVYTGSGGTTTIINCTISGNSAAQNGGGLYNASGTVTIGNTIVAGNTATTGGPDAFGALASQGHNLIGETDGSSGWVGSDLTGTIAQPLNPLLAALANYGGPTETMPLLPGGPAIDAGNNALIPTGVTTDQRGYARIVNGTVDIGAFEVQSIPLVVNTTADGDGPLGKLDLRGAVDLSDLLPGAHTITFDPTVFASAQTITLTAGQLELSNTSGTQTIIGPAAGVTIGGGGLSRVFQVDGGVTAALSGLTISGGSAAGNGGGLYNDGGTTTLIDVTISGNSASGSGGGLANIGGTTTLTNCTVSGNAATNGGALYNSNSGVSILADCTISGNSASGSGGGLDNVSAEVTIANTIVADNTAAASGPDVFGTFASQGHNLIGETDGSSGWAGSDLTGTIAQPLDSLLAPLGDYGGPTQTMALLPGSPAIGKGIVLSGGTTDQRGLIRGATVDIGAFQTSLVVESTSGSSIPPPPT